jgi:hypothetical protein
LLPAGDKSLKNFQKLPIQITLNQRLNHLFPPVFISNHTQFPNWESMIKASGFSAQSDEDFAAIPDDEWDKFIRENTKFSNWESMLESATQLRKKAGLI